MPDLAHWGVFFGATIILLLVPGPSVMYVVAQGIGQGYRAALFSAAGLALGDLFQVLCTVGGLSALLASSVVLFTSLKYAGATYLIFLGVRRLCDKKVATSLGATGRGRAMRRRSSRSLLLQGFLALNPKTALFFLALFPQFVAQNAAPPWLQILCFGCAFVALGFITNSLYGCLGGKLASATRHSSHLRVMTRYVSGGILVAFGVAAALAPTSRAGAPPP